MPLNTTFEQNNSIGKNFFRVSGVKLRVVMSVFAYHVASSDCSVIILILVESVESQLANRYLVCADLISNKGILP